VQFTIGKMFDSGSGNVCLQAHHFLQQNGRHAPGEIDLAAKHGPNRDQHFCGGLFFHEVTHRPGAKGALGVHGGFVLGKNQDFELGMLGLQRFDQLEAIAAAQAKIEDHKVGRAVRNSRLGGGDAIGLPATNQVAVLGNQLEQAVTDHRVVIDNQYARWG
jgi:hypothetical protein